MPKCSWSGAVSSLRVGGHFKGIVLSKVISKILCVLLSGMGVLFRVRCG